MLSDKIFLQKKRSEELPALLLFGSSLCCEELLEGLRVGLLLCKPWIEFKDAMEPVRPEILLPQVFLHRRVSCHDRCCHDCFVFWRNLK